MSTESLLRRAAEFDHLSPEEGAWLFEKGSTAELMAVAHELRNQQATPGVVTWIIDRNVNTTNVCIANCKFCNFFRVPGDPEAYITDIETYKRKIEEMIRYGGDQLLLQGGHHPNLGLTFYTDLFRTLKALYPQVKLHALGPPEVWHICELEDMAPRDVLSALMDAGLDSFPGAGAEILVDRVRRLISHGKCTAGQWLDVMREAHKLGLTTSATMMFGHVETIRERMEHLVALRQVQDERPPGAKGFLAFIPWPWQDEGTLLNRVKGLTNKVTSREYIRMIAISRIMLPNVRNIQASWLTVGRQTAQICLHAGANDFGSIMIEENVVSAAGAPHRFTASGIQKAIREAGFEPRLRNQQYEFRQVPEAIEEQIIAY
jgi:cyclic dehypoxanthinyl futalosine synthase